MSTSNHPLCPPCVTCAVIQVCMRSSPPVRGALRSRAEMEGAVDVCDAFAEVCLSVRMIIDMYQRGVDCVV